jgi:hypothetical protein
LASAAHPLTARGDTYLLALIREHDYGALWEDMLAALDGFLEAALQGRRDQWLRKHFGALYPCDTENKEVLGDLVVANLRTLGRAIYQCGRCGRLWVEAGTDPTTFCPFRPEGDWPATLPNPRREQAR